ncbi:MAG: hypothetical protein M3235_22595 [Actinomycetota bacterium]|nr:hypothetical protein [Actinomycetota bacterium]
MQPDHVWTHVTEDQAAGRACVMCGRPTDEPGWAGVVVGCSDDGSPVYACSGGEGRILGGDERGNLRPTDQRPSERNCAEQAAVVVPDSPEGLGL